MNRKEKGKQKEQQAVEFLQRKGYNILSRNFRTRFAEIDIVAKDGGTLVFVEVRSRAYVSLGRPEESINKRKQKKLTMAASAFLAGYRQNFDAVRFDVVAISGDEIVHIENAFWVDSVI